MKFSSVIIAIASSAALVLSKPLPTATLLERALLQNPGYQKEVVADVTTSWSRVVITTELITAAPGATPGAEAYNLMQSYNYAVTNTNNAIVNKPDLGQYAGLQWAQAVFTRYVAAV